MATATITRLPERRKFNVEEYFAMGEAGILTKGDGIELLDGELFCKYDGRRRRFTVDEYRAMAEAGILRPDERVELLAGEVIEMAAIGSRHAFCVDEFSERLATLALSGRARVRTQNPIRLDQENHPQPDIAVVVRSNYAGEHPGPEDVFLLIEVSDSTVGFDRRHKLPLYAMYGIPEVWLSDVNSRTIEVHDEPMAGGYARIRVYAPDERLSPAAFPDVVIAVADVIPE